MQYKRMVLLSVLFALGLPNMTGTALEEEQIANELRFLQVYQTYLLKKVGCYRNLKPPYLSADLRSEDCGKPREIDYKAFNDAKKLAMKVWGLKE